MFIYFILLCILGTTLESNGQIKRKYIPHELHFASIANRLQWKTLPIIDWIDIDTRSQEYSFLKELGVKEVPDLHKLISRIDEEHNNGTKTKVDYKLPKSLVFFAEYFQEHYSKLWKNVNIKIPFLPSSLPDENRSTEVILTTPDIVFKGLFKMLIEFLFIFLFKKNSLHYVHLYLLMLFDVFHNILILVYLVLNIVLHYHWHLIF